MRAYVWAQALAAKISTNHPPDQAAQAADQALAEFDKRTFEHLSALSVEEAHGHAAELELRVTALEGELATAQEQVIQAEQKIADLEAEAAMRDQEVIAPASSDEL